MATDPPLSPQRELRPRLCTMKKGANGYGFNLHSDKSRPGQFIRAVDPDSPAEASGLRAQDRIVEVMLPSLFPGTCFLPTSTQTSIPGAAITPPAPWLAQGVQGAQMEGGREPERGESWWVGGPEGGQEGRWMADSLIPSPHLLWVLIDGERHSVAQDPPSPSSGHVGSPTECPYCLRPPWWQVHSELFVWCSGGKET